MNLRRWLWLIPAAAALAWSWTYASLAPEPFEWRAVWREPPLTFAWSRFIDFSDRANEVVFRALHLGGLELGLDPRALALLAWLLALGVVIGIGRACVQPMRMTAGAKLLVAAALFSPAFAADWLLFARFRLFLPVACALLAILALRGSRARGWRFAVAAALCQIALFTHATGNLLWLALAPLVALEAFAAHRSVLTPTAVWIVLGNLGLLVCRDGERVRPGLGGTLWTSPLSALQSLARVGGVALPDVLPGTTVDGIVLGALLLVATLACSLLAVQRRQRTEHVAEFASWLSIALVGIAIIVSMTHELIPIALADGLIKEMCWGATLLPIGLVGALFVLAPRRMARVAGPLLGVALLLLGQEYARGWRSLRLEHTLLRQGEALLAFADAATNELPKAPSPPIRYKRERDALRARGQLGASIAKLSLDALTTGNPGGGTFATLAPTIATGTIARRSSIDLVLLVRQLGTTPPWIFKIAAPDRFAATRDLPWTAALADVDRFAEGEVLRAFGYDCRAGRIHRLVGGFRFRAGRFVELPREQR